MVLSTGMTQTVGIWLVIDSMMRSTRSRILNVRCKIRSELMPELPHPLLYVGPKIKLPPQWVRCPLCDKHYVLENRESQLYCNMIVDI